MKHYKPDYIPLSTGLQCLIDGGVDPSTSKLELCRAINDGALRYRAYREIDETGMPLGIVDKIQGMTAGVDAFDWENSTISKDVLNFYNATRIHKLHIARLEISADDFNKIWHIDPRLTAATNRDSHEGDERYSTPYIQLLLRAIIELEISDTNQPKKETIVEWFAKQTTGDVKLSARMIDYMATMVRKPDMQRGGAHPRKRS